MLIVWKLAVLCRSVLLTMKIGEAMLLCVEQSKYSSDIPTPTYRPYRTNPSITWNMRDLACVHLIGSSDLILHIVHERPTRSTQSARARYHQAPDNSLKPQLWLKWFRSSPRRRCHATSCNRRKSAIFGQKFTFVGHHGASHVDRSQSWRRGPSQDQPIHQSIQRYRICP